MVSINTKPKAKVNPKSPAAIIAEADRPKVYTVWSDFAATDTVSGKEWNKGQKIWEKDDVVDYGTDLASVGLDGLPLALSRDEIYERWNNVLSDSEQAEANRIDDLQTAHLAKRKGPNISAVADTAQIDPLIEELAPLLAEAIGADVDKGWEATKATRYIAAVLAYDIKKTIPPEKLAQFPDCHPDNKRPPKAPIRSNQKYNVGYRSRINADWGPPSWVGDMYDTMPDVGNIRLGVSVKAELNRLNPEHKAEKALPVEEIGGRDSFKEKKAQRTNGIKNCQDALRVIQRMAELNEFDHVSCEFRMHPTIEDKPDLQNMTPIKVIGYKNKDDKKRGRMSAFGYFPLQKVINWQIKNLSRKDALFGAITTADKTTTRTIEPIDSALGVYQEFGRVSKWFSGGQISGRKVELQTALESVNSVSGPDQVAGVHKNQQLINDVLNLINVLSPHKTLCEEAIRKDALLLEAAKEDEKNKAKETDAKVQAALSNGHKAA